MVETEPKKWYKSKMVWVNVITIGALVVQSSAGFIIAPEEQMGIIAVINLILRAVTAGGLEA